MDRTATPNLRTQASLSTSSSFLNKLVRWRRPLTLLAVVIIGLIIGLQFAPKTFPADVSDDVGVWIDNRIDEITRNGDFLFDNISEYTIVVLVNLRDFFLWVPWPIAIGMVGILAWRIAGLGVAVFGIASLTLVGFTGLWESAMETLSLMVTAVAISLAIAIPIGLLAARNNTLDNLVRPVLDGMQTMPSFVYLVPAILFFSLGNVPAVFATIIYAMPPAVRLTNLGIRQVDSEVVEAAKSFGSTGWQLLFKVEIPLAMPTIMAGINQTTMMALAMVVVASLVGAGGLGEDVLRAIGRLEVGNSALAGAGIVALAIILDRMIQGITRAQESRTSRRRSPAQ